MEKIVHRRPKIIPTEDQKLKKIEEAFKNPSNDLDILIEQSNNEKGYSLLNRKVLYNRLKEDLSELLFTIGYDSEVYISELEIGPLNIKYDIVLLDFDGNGKEMIGEISFNIFYPKYDSE